MKFFKYFQSIFYPTQIASNGVQSDFVQTKNIMLAVRMREALRNNTVFFYDYVISEEDRPDIISSKYYGSADYVWLLFLVNDIIDPIYDWPLTYYEFNQYLIKKYGSLEYTHQNVKRYLTLAGLEIDYDSWLDIPEVERDSQTIYEWENSLNEAKRNIKILEDTYLNKVLSEIRDIMSV